MLSYRGGTIFVEDIPLARIADAVGTPLYVYSKRQLLANYRAYEEAFEAVPHQICYALKANANPFLLELLAKEGSGADVVSGGELHLALRAGFPPEKIVFSGVGKTPAEIDLAIRKEILALHIESEQELYQVDMIAGRLRRKTRIGFRVNPDIDAKTHPYISTGLHTHKFGIPLKQARDLYRKATKLPNVQITGLHMHLGSHITSTQPFSEALQRILPLIESLSQNGIRLKHLDIGGGLAIDVYPSRLASAISAFMKKTNLEWIVEPGRSIVANSGILVMSVLYTKQNNRKRFVIVDAGMNDFLRPALYNSSHEIRPARKTGKRRIKVDVVGPVCETADFLARDQLLQPCNPGDLLILMEAGAYGYSMSSNYNGRLRSAEVLADGQHFSIIRRREKYSDLH